jgi:hypothetical protein
MVSRNWTLRLNKNQRTDCLTSSCSVSLTRCLLSLRSEIYWCQSLGKFVLYLPRDESKGDILETTVAPRRLPTVSAQGLPSLPSTDGIHPPVASKKRGRPRKETQSPSSSPLDQSGIVKQPQLQPPIPPPARPPPQPPQRQHGHEDLRHVIAVDCLADSCLECLVSKSSLVGYQYESSLNLLRSGAVDSDTLAFILALAYFADWDDYDRESYLWDHSSVIEMIRSPVRWKAWRTHLLTHESCSLVHDLLSGFRSKFYCFFLCVDVLDLMDEIPSLTEALRPAIQAMQVAAQTKGKDGSEPSETVSPHLVPLTPPQTILLKLLEDVRNLTPNGLNSTFRRVSCRVGSQYQAVVTPFSCSTSSASSLSVSSSSSSSSPAIINTDSEVVYRSDHLLPASEIESYLMAARRLIPIQAGYLIDTVKPTVSSAALATSLVPPSPSKGDTKEESEKKIAQYEQRLTHLTRLGKLKPGMGLSQTMQTPSSFVQKFPVPPSSRSVPSSALPPSLANTPHVSSSSSSSGPPPVPTPASSSSPTVSMVVKSALDAPFLVFATDCRQKYCWDDSLLEILHRSRYDPPSALTTLQSCAGAAGLISDSSLSHPLSDYYNMRRWSRDAIQIFFQTIR